ncbi:hypothetical protein AAG906_017510 [Vitis piasezkii]
MRPGDHQLHPGQAPLLLRSQLAVLLRRKQGYQLYLEIHSILEVPFGALMTPVISSILVHIAEALRIPYEPARPKDYRVWAHPSQSDMVHILSRGTSTHPYLLRKELPPSMFFIDALLRHNIYPLQHIVQRRGALLEALFRILEGFFFGPHHLIMAALLYFEEKGHKKKLVRADAIPLLFPRLLCQILEHLGYLFEP